MLPASLLPLVFLPDEMVRLRSIVMLGRCYEGKLRGTCHRFWDHYPPKEWVLEVQRRMLEPAVSQPTLHLSPDTFDELAEQLRLWRAPLLEQMADEDDQRMSERSLRRHVAWLSRSAQQLRTGRDVTTSLDSSASSSIKHSAQRLLAVFQASTHFKYRKKDFGSVLKSVVEAAWPSLFDAAVLKPSWSESFAWRSQLILEMALAIDWKA